MPLSLEDFNPLDPQCDPQTQDLGQTSLDIINDVMTGNAFQNPVGTIVNTAKAIAQDNELSITNILDNNENAPPGTGLQPATVSALQSMNNLLGELNGQPGAQIGSPNAGILNNIKDATDRMSGAVNTLDANAFNQNNIVSLSDTFNSMKANLRLPGQDVIEDNFGPNFNLILEDGGLTLMQSVGASNNILQQTIGSFLGGDIQENELVQQVTDLAGGLTETKNNALDSYNQTVDNLSNMRNMVQKYGVANTLIAAVRSNPCWTGQLMKEFAVPGLQGKLDALQSFEQGTSIPSGTFSIPTPELPEAPPFVAAGADAINQAKAKANELAEEVGNAVRSVQSGITEFAQGAIDTVSASAKNAIAGIQESLGSEGLLAMSASEAGTTEQRAAEAQNVIGRL
jgi:hypothetical protein